MKNAAFSAICCKEIFFPPKEEKEKSPQFEIFRYARNKKNRSAIVAFIIQ